MTHPFDGVDLRAEPGRYQIGRGEFGVFHAEPYKGELLPLWTIVDVESAQGSIRAIVARFDEYKAQADFVGMDMARKYLQMGFTRASRYANHPGGRKRAADGTPLPAGPSDPVKAAVASLYRAAWRSTATDPEYVRLKAAFQRGRAR